jgi:hypothetical protein
VEGEQMLAIMAGAKTWGCRPSSLLAIEDPVLALMVDLAATRRAMEMASGEESGPVERIEL